MPEEFAEPLKILELLEERFEDRVQQKIRRVMSKLGSYQGRVYVCKDNGRLYRRKPRNCNDIVETSIDELIFREVKEYVAYIGAQLEAIRWVVLNCGDVLKRLNARIYIDFPPAIFFDYGIIYGYSTVSNEPKIYVAVQAEYDPDVALLLETLDRCPYATDIVVWGRDNDSFRPKEAVALLLDLELNR